MYRSLYYKEVWGGALFHMSQIANRNNFRHYLNRNVPKTINESDFQTEINITLFIPMFQIELYTTCYFFLVLANLFLNYSGAQYYINFRHTT